MDITQQIIEMEEKLRQAELASDAAFFSAVLDDDAVLDGQKAKAKVVAAHSPGGPAKFTDVGMSAMSVTPQGDSAAVVTCTGAYTGAKGTFKIDFMRVWLKRGGDWKIIAGTTGQPRGTE